MSELNNPLIIFLLLLFAIFGLPALLQRFPGKAGKQTLPYHSKYILTTPEYRFYKALKPLMDARGYLICPKVGLKDLFEVTKGTKDREKYFRKISQKHVDFLICDADLRPLFAIELDDKSHNRAEVKERDQFKDTLFKSAGFPLYRVPTVSSYTEAYLIERLSLSVESASQQLKREQSEELP